MKFGIDRLLADASLRRELAGRRLGLLAHPASVTRDLAHSLDALLAVNGIHVTSAFGPQHGLRGDKQDNMIESPDYRDPTHGIPVFSLYGEVRRPTPAMLDTFDVLLVDLQDLGCRVYTFITTLRYVLNAILGEWPELKGFSLANGFSGHGLQQGPAVGRYMSELILGVKPALDLTIFSPRRILENKPLSEGGIV